MELKNISYNIVNKVLDSNIRIYYENHNSIFDAIFKELNYFIVNETNSVGEHFYYDMKIINDYFRYINNFNDSLMDMQISNLVFFHQKCPPQLKKEDRIILGNSLRKTQKVIFTESNLIDWNFDNSRTTLIKYGIPKYENEINPNRKTKEILILNLRNNDQLQTLFQHIKNQYQNTDIITSIAGINIKKIYEILSQYKIVIDIDTPVNALSAISCGCISLGVDKFDEKINSHIQILDFRTINGLIQNILNSNNINEVVSQDIAYIQKNYNFENFEKLMSSLILKTKKEPFLK
jgi:hypothetical protein